MSFDGMLVSRADLEVIFEVIGECACGHCLTASNAAHHLVSVCGHCGRIHAYDSIFGLQEYSIDHQLVYEEMFDDPNSAFHMTQN